MSKNKQSLLIFPSVTETAEALPGTAGTGNSNGAVCGLQWGKSLLAPALAAWDLKNPAVEVNGVNPSFS